jgi:phenylacetate-CoA ligase
MFWEKEIEQLQAAELNKLQLERLNRSLARSARSRFYGGRFGKSGPPKLRSLDELALFPFTTKEDLRSHFPYGFLSVPQEEVIRLHSSSGTTGNPTVVYHTSHDIDEWKNLMARSIYMAGARNTDVFQNMMGYGLFTGGLGLHYGAEKIGMLTIPIGYGNTQRQIWFMQRFGTTVLHLLPSYALKLAGTLEEMGIRSARDLTLKIIFIGAEPHTTAMREKIERALGVKAYDCYGLSEMCGPGVAFECKEQNGLHLWEDQFLMEIINPETGQRLSEGEEGELVLTTLNREAMPLIRFRTRDLTAIIPGACPCGRTHRRIMRIKGRDDDMLIINGVNLFPMQIEKVLMNIPGVGTNYLIEIYKDNYMDKLQVKVEVHGALFKGTLPDLERLEQEITSLLKSELLVTPVVKLVEPGSLPQTEGKAKRVIDLRKIEI